MKKGQVYEGIIESVEFPNKGRIYLPEEDRWVVVKNGVPGQKVRFSVNKIRKGKAEGRLLEVLEPSPVRCTPRCEFAVSQRDSVSLSTFRTVRRLYLSESSV